MLVSDQPGCWGDAARLPKNPGIQKLTPPSSAVATVSVPMRMPRTAMQCLNSKRDMPCPNGLRRKNCDSGNQFNGVRAARDASPRGDPLISYICGANVTVAVRSRRRDTCFEAPPEQPSHTALSQILASKSPTPVAFLPLEDR